LITEEPETKRRLMLAVKSNLAALSDGLGFNLEQRIVAEDIAASHVVWSDQPAVAN